MNTFDNPNVAGCAIGNHDWRVDPFISLPTNPPRARVVCAWCEMTSSRPYRDRRETPPDPNDVRTWPHAE